MGVCKNNGTPKSSILIGFSIINHPFWGTPIFGNTYIWIPFPYLSLFQRVYQPHTNTKQPVGCLHRDQLLWIAWKVSANALPLSCWLLQRWDGLLDGRKFDKAKSVLLSEVA